MEARALYCWEVVESVIAAVAYYIQEKLDDSAVDINEIVTMTEVLARLVNIRKAMDSIC